MSWLERSRCLYKSLRTRYRHKEDPGYRVSQGSMSLTVIDNTASDSECSCFLASVGRFMRLDGVSAFLDCRVRFGTRLILWATACGGLIRSGSVAHPSSLGGAAPVALPDGGASHTRRHPSDKSPNPIQVLLRSSYLSLYYYVRGSRTRARSATSALEG